jgi:TonB family protein
MITLQPWLAATQMIGWTLVHFLWQAAVLGLVYALARPLLARGVVRYRFGMSVLVALALCPFATLWWLLEAVPPSIPANHGLFVPAVAAQAPIAGDFGASAGFDALLPWLVLGWLLGVSLHSVRVWRQWHAMKTVVRMAERLPRWQQRVADMAQRFGLRRRITVLGSRVIAAPVLIGWMRPVIVMPMAVLCGFPASQIELILAHELAHLRRWDPLFNLFQVALETAHFYHPVVRWISRDVTNEREICCDQLALSRGGGNRREFVTMLAGLGDLRVQQQRLLLAANGGQLLERAQLMMLPPRPVVRARKGASALALLFCAAVVMAIGVRVQRIRAEMGESADTTIHPFKELVLPASASLVKPVAAWMVPAAIQIPFASVTLFEARLDKTPAHSVAAPMPVSLPSPTGTSISHLRLNRMEVPRLRIVPVAVTPATAAAAPVPVHVRQPVYPPGALRRAIEGRVVLEFSLGADGSVRDLQMISATPAGVFDEAALEAMRSWKYAVPGGASSTRYRQILSFTLRAGRSASLGSTTGSMRDIWARPACQIPTGTHICRYPDDAAPPAPAAAVRAGSR